MMMMIMRIIEKGFLQSIRENFQMESIILVLSSQVNIQIDFADDQYNIAF